MRDRSVLPQSGQKLNWKPGDWFQERSGAAVFTYRLEALGRLPRIGLAGRWAGTCASCGRPIEVASTIPPANLRRTCALHEDRQHG